MAPTLKDILQLLESVSPAELAEPWDNPGLQVGTPSQEIKKIFTSLDPTIGALQRAIDAGAQMLLTHHPLIFKPVFRVNSDSFPGNVIAGAIKKNVAIVCAHTNLDASKDGMNDILADLLGLAHVEILKENAEGKDGAGMGRIGDLAEALPLEAFLRKISGIFQLGSMKVAGERAAVIQRVAVVGGSGGSFLAEAHKNGADLFLTGDVTHHVALDAKTLGLVLVDGGHFALENAAFNVFAGFLQNRLKTENWDVSVQKDEKNADPLRMERWERPAEIPSL